LQEIHQHQTILDTHIGFVYGYRGIKIGKKENEREEREKRGGEGEREKRGGEGERACVGVGVGVGCGSGIRCLPLAVLKWRYLKG
jgi:hypothetical protein